MGGTLPALDKALEVKGSLLPDFPQFACFQACVRLQGILFFRNCEFDSMGDQGFSSVSGAGVLPYCGDNHVMDRTCLRIFWVLLFWPQSKLHVTTISNCIDYLWSEGVKEKPVDLLDKLCVRVASSPGFKKIFFVDRQPILPWNLNFCFSDVIGVLKSKRNDSV